MIDGIKYPPLREPLTAPDGSLSRVWFRFFQDLKNYTDKVADEVVSGRWQMRLHSPLTVTEDTYLSVSDFGKTVKADLEDNDAVLFLPSVEEKDIDGSFTIMRFGSGRLAIQAADQDTIETSRPGGGIYCHESRRIVANVTIYLASETKWGITGATGTWYLY